ncbi:autotransporter outer membrane beta-barrel domain-containing protein [Megasphaera sp. SW808]|uniref:autotransporter outer membrane beta-barrel domain-containing protein n=1 Tax=Megasphaera sp. SW808 TaxID=2530045 RepID=UPI00143B627D|nr:autotransporter outer membrane beta-barrel domain-containing protein [Megasphaera sp. SW808]
MNKKRLRKQISLALMLFGIMPMAASAEVTAYIDNNKLIVNSDETIAHDKKFNIDGKDYYLNDFSDVELYFSTDKDANRALGVYSERFDLEDTNISVYVDGKSNADGLHLSNHYPNFYIKNYTAIINAVGSDAINLSRDVTTDVDVIIKENLKVHLKTNGNGIRANASINGDIENPNVASITVNGDTDIQLDGDAGNLLSAALSGNSINPTAVWAGSDANSLTAKQQAKGKGEVFLNGKTKIVLNGNGTNGLFGGGKVYGILTGKNGYINVNDLDITANGNYNYGIAATEVNISYNSDDTVNNFGSKIELNGEKNVITMNGNNSYAIYAEGIDANGNSNSVKSGENGIGYINFEGNIEAENGGLIDLTVHGYENNQNILVGDIKAYGTAENTESIDQKTAVRLNVEDSLRHVGDALAADGGTVNVTLGNGSVWIGRADDYQDAADSTWIDEHLGQFESSFSGDVHKNGTVTVDMGTGSTWKVKGQSWITELKGNNSDIVLDGENGGSYAVHIGKIEGNNNFIVTLKPDDLVNSDMIYVKDGTNATQHLTIQNSEDVLKMDVGDKIRFATVANAGGGFDKDGNVSGEVSTFGRSTRINDKGMFDVDFDVVYESYATDELQGTTVEDEYNGGSEFSDSTAKPGTDYTDAEYGTGENPYNVYLVREGVTKDNVSDAGKTVIAMSKVNYSNAIYMDRLNKRMGEARYIDGDEGLWVRMRHDRIGKSDAFRSMNTMMELGYDTRVNDREDGEHRQGVAIDYMRGTADYKNVAGEGDVRRGGIWFYDTWLGNKGHYTDYVLKFGRLSNDFELYTRTLGEKVTGDYSNFVYSASAEYGRKKDLGNNWYIEPQAQIQYAHVTDADYTTSQDTHVQLDAIDSLIGRVGFRLGKDVGEKSTFYIKADVLHEFLGDQDIEARDATGLLSTTYENEGTWYDIGLGFSHQFSKGTYMYLDMEKSIGNDNEDTYQFNFGMNWKV